MGRAVKNFSVPVTVYQLFRSLNQQATIPGLTYTSSQRVPFFLWSGKLTSVPSFPPPNPIPVCASALSHNAQLCSQPNPSTFPKGWPASPRATVSARPLQIDQRGAAPLQRVKEAKLRAGSLQKSMLTKDRHANKPRKSLFQPLPPFSLPAPRRSVSAHPGGQELPSVLPSPCSRSPLCLQSRRPSPWL